MSLHEQTAGAKFHLLSEAIRASKGYRIEREIIDHQASYRILEGNYRELKRMVNNYRQEEFAFRSFDRKENPDDSDLIEAVRLIHNFLASTKTLADHSDVFIKRMYSGNKF